jgi:hypothetical protein
MRAALSSGVRLGNAPAMLCRGAWPAADRCSESEQWKACTSGSRLVQFIVPRGGFAFGRDDSMRGSRGLVAANGVGGLFGRILPSANSCLGGRTQSNRSFALMPIRRPSAVQKSTRPLTYRATRPVAGFDGRRCIWSSVSSRYPNYIADAGRRGHFHCLPKGDCRWSLKQRRTN